MSIDSMQPTTEGPPEEVDWLIEGALLLTLDPANPLIPDGTLALKGPHIVDVGPSASMRGRYVGRERLQARRFLAMPGLINAHCHITGETLSRGFQPDGVGHVVGLRDWALPLYAAHTPEDERLSAQLAALEMLRSGTTAFIEAGSTQHLDAVADGLDEIGIRARVGRWTWDRSNAPTRPAIPTDQAIRQLEVAVDHHPDDGRRVVAWPSLVGHSAVSDALWQAAATLARARGLGMTAHMSPVPDDPAHFLTHHGRRPIAHLDELGVLGPWLTLAHAIHLDADEVDRLARAGAHVAHCPTSALRFGYGVTRHGRMPEMVAAGVPLCLGTDGANSGGVDLLRAAAITAGLFKDARERVDLFPPELVLRLLTHHGASAMRMAGQLGMLRAGCRADVVLHDTWRPEWRPLLDPVELLVGQVDGRSVHSVWVDGERVIADQRSTRLDEDRLLDDAQRAGEALVARTPTPGREAWRPIGARSG